MAIMPSLMQATFRRFASRRQHLTGRSPSPANTVFHVLSEFWAQGFAILQLCIALVGVARYESPGAIAYAALCTYYVAITLLVFFARRFGVIRQRSFPYFIWVSGTLGAFFFVLISPNFTSVAMFALVNTIVHVISLPQISAKQVRWAGLGTITAAVALLSLAEFGLWFGPIFELRLFAASSSDIASLVRSDAIVLSPESAAALLESFFRSIWIIGFTGNIVHLMWNFHHRIQKNVSSLRTTNQDLAIAQRALQQRLHERTQLLEMTRTIASTQDFSSLLRNALIQLKSVVDYGRATVLLLNEEHMEEISTVGHLASIAPSGLTHKLQDAFGLDSITSMHKPMLLSDPAKYDLTGSHLFVPLIARGKLIGMLAIRHAAPRFYTEHDADLCMAYANQVAGIIASAQLQRAAAGALVVAERNRLARELHDSVSQSLFGIVLGTRTALQQVDASPEAARTALLYSVDLAAAALAEMRALIFTMRPETLEQRGLVVALRQQIDLLQPQQKGDITITLEASEEPDMSMEIKEAFYRIAIEAMQNAIRHAKCSHLQIRLTRTDSAISLEVRDDGQGFDPNKLYSGHLGLKTMHERATDIGGALRIDSGASGSCIVVTLPTPARA